MGYQGDFVYELDKPKGMHSKRMDIQQLRAFGWTPSVSLETGLKQTIAYYEQEVAHPLSAVESA